MRKKIKLERLPYGRIKAEGYVFTKHFIDKWKERNVNSPTDEKVVLDALSRLKNSRLSKLKPNGEELRIEHDLVFVLKDKTVITVMYTFTKHRFEETDFYYENIPC